MRLARLVLVMLVAAVLVPGSAGADSGAVPERPERPVVDAVGHDFVTLSWEDPGDGTVTGYQVLRRNRDSDALGDFTIVADDVASTVYTDHGVEPATRYGYRIKARNAHGLSLRSKAARAQTLTEPVTEAPSEPGTEVLSEPTEPGTEVLEEPTEVDGSSDPYEEARAGAVGLGDITWARRAQTVSATLDGAQQSVHYYRFRLELEMFVELDLRHQDADGDVVLEDADGTVLAQSRSAGTADESIYKLLEPGQYYIRVESQEPGTNTYQLSYEGLLSSDPHDLGDFTARIASQPGRWYVAAGVGGSGNQLDYYSFTLRKPRTLHVWLEVREGDLDLFLEDLDGTVVQASRTAGAITDEALEVTLPEGTWHLVVRPQQPGSNLSYRLWYWVSRPQEASGSEPGTPGAPGAPTNVRVEPSGAAGLEVSWTAPVDDGGDPVDHYEVVWRSDQEGYNDFYDDTNRSITINSTSANIENLVAPPGAGDLRPTYEVLVRAVNGNGSGGWSTPSSGQPVYAPDAPRITSIEVVDGTKLKIVWEPPTSDRGSPITGYTITYSKLDWPNWTSRATAQASATEREYTTPALDVAATWRFRIAAESDVGTGRNSSYAIGEPYAAPVRPRNVRATSSDSIVTVRWVLDTSGDDAATGSVLRWREQGGTEADWTTVDLDAAYVLVHTIEGLTNGTTYEMQVAAVNEDGMSGWSDAVTATPAAAPGAPRDVTVESGKLDRLLVEWTWTDSTTFPVTGFVIKWRLSTASSYPDANTAEVAAGDRQYTIEDVWRGYSYIVKVSAVNNDTVHGSATVAGYTRTAEHAVHRLFLPEFETANPWIRVPLDRSDIDIYASLFGKRGFVVSVEEDRNGWQLKRITAVAYAPRVLHDPDDADNQYVFFHELGHVVTLDWRLVTEPLAVMMLHNHRQLRGNCQAREILADTIGYAALKTEDPNAEATLAYYPDCVLVDDKPSGATVRLAQSVLAGSVPQWFYNRYRSSLGDIDHETLWYDMRSPRFVRGRTWYAMGFGLRHSFGGFCSVREALESYKADRDSTTVTANPWADGGCESHRPQNVSVTTGDGSLVVSWEAPLWTQEPQADGYVVQWRAPGEDYRSTRQTVLSGLSSLSTTISGLSNGTLYTIRVAAVDTTDPGNFLHSRGHKRYTQTSARPSA